MPRHALALVAASLLAVAGAPAASAAEPSVTTASGVILDVAGEPVRDTCVSFILASKPYEYPVDGTCEVDDEGRWELTIDPGDYFVQARGDHHVSRYYGGNYYVDIAQVVEVPRGAEVTDIDIELELPATVTGRMVDSRTGKPVDDACASFALLEETHYVDEGWGCSHRDGSFTVRGLPPTTVTFKVRTPRSDPQLWQWAYGAEEFADAARFPLEPEQTTDVGDVPVDMLGTVRGKVVDERTGEPLAGIAVAIGGYGPRSGECRYCTRTNEQGRYRLIAIEGGSHVPVAWADWPDWPKHDYAVEWLGGAVDPSLGRAIDVVEGETARANFQLNPAATIVGTLPPGDDPMGVDAVSLYNRGRGLGFSSDVNPETGEFTIRGLPETGVYLAFTSYEGETQRRFYHDGVWTVAEATFLELRYGKKTEVVSHFPAGLVIGGKPTTAPEARVGSPESHDRLVAVG